MKIILKLISVIIAVYVISDAIKINIQNYERISFIKKDSQVQNDVLKAASVKPFNNDQNIILVSR